MGSLDLDHPLKKLGQSIRTLSLDRQLTVKWSESLKLVIEEFPHESDVMENRSTDQNAEEALEGELVLLKAAYALSNVNRRLSLSKLLELQGNVRVVCRVRPFLPCEALSPEEASPVEIVSPTEVRVSCQGEPTKTFKFDRVFPPRATQEDVFWDVQPIIKSAMDGHNVCIFSYGQTGTGKTFTMEGDKSSPGIVPRTLHQLFKEKDLQHTVHSFRLTLSMLEIYKGTLRDLLVPRSTRLNDPPPKTLSIHMSVSEHVEVENLTEYVIENAADALKFYRKGVRARSTSPTSSNESSSRSHCLVRVSITRSNAEDIKARKSSVTKLWLIDLGGSERFFKTQAWGKPLEEGKAINVSLSALGDVISALQKKQPHIPYRNSKLTQILRDCLGCTSKVVMFVHASPKAEDYGETICSLTFASRARGIHLNRMKVQEKEARISGIVEKMEALEGECQRLSVDIQALESSIKEKKVGSQGVDVKHDKSRLQLEHHDSGKLHGRKSDQQQSVPRFMTPTISSLCKNRAIVHDFEPVWPEKKLVAKLPHQLSMNKPGGSLPSFVISSSTWSPQQSVDLCGKRSSAAASRRRSTGGDHQLCVQTTPWNYNHRSAAQHELVDDGSSPTKAGSKSHVRNGSKDVRNFSKIQRRLTLECSSKVSVNL